MRKGRDLEHHRRLVEELVAVFLKEGYNVTGADGVEGYYPPVELRNDGYGDQEDKTPDVYAYDEKNRRYVIGEAKTGNNDFETDHALTQYNVYLDQFHRSTGAQAMVYVIVPSSKVAEFNTLITHYIHPDYWASLALVASTKADD